eukprot:2121754-Rhodomonas_salina.1
MVFFFWVFLGGAGLFLVLAESDGECVHLEERSVRAGLVSAGHELAERRGREEEEKSEQGGEGCGLSQRQRGDGEIKEIRQSSWDRLVLTRWRCVFDCGWRQLVAGQEREEEKEREGERERRRARERRREG